MDNKYDYNKHYKIKEMCELFNIKYDSHNPNRSLEEIERLYELEKISPQKYRIVKEWSEDEKVFRWKSTEYKRLFKDIVYTTLSCSENNKIWKSDNDYMVIFHMVNKNFEKFTKNYIFKPREEFLTEHNKDVFFEGQAMYFAHEVRQMLRQILRDTFKKMEDENLIFVKEHYIFGIIKSYTDPKDNKTKTYSVPKVASDDEIELFMAGQTKVLQDNELDNLYSKIDDIRDSKVRYELRQQLSEKLGIQYYSLQRELILNRYGLQYKVEHNDELRELKRHLNKGTINKVLSSNQGHLKEMDKYLKGELAHLLIEIHDKDILI